MLNTQKFFSQTLPVGTGVLFVALALFAGVSSAQNPFDALQFPIAELGGCGSLEECKLYCDEPTNVRSCSAWARAHGFSTGGGEQRHERGGQQGAQDDRRGEHEGENEFDRRAREVLKTTTGPGGCRTFEECDAYCSQDAHHDECFAFAREHNLFPDEEFERIERERAERTGPGGCRSEEECRAYCRNPEHTRECVAFGLEKGHLNPEEAARILSQIEHARNVATEVQGRVGEISGRVRGKIERFDDGRRRGPRGPQIRGPEPQINKEKAKQILEAQGGPGGCRTHEACEQFCNTPENGETCMQFALEHDLMSGPEADRLRKLMDSTGPGGCKGRACEQYCEEPGHELECLSHAEGLGLIDKAEADRARSFMRRAEERGLGCRGRECEDFCERPGNRHQCFEAFKDLIPEEERKHIEKFQAIEERVQHQGGPGGCKGESECHQYCSDSAHFDECAAFAVEAGLFSPEDAEQMLKQFINVEQFRSGGRGGGGGGPEGFRPPPGFEDFGELGMPSSFEHFGDFELPEGVPPEVRAQFKAQFEQQLQGEYKSRFEEEFRSRAGQFEQFRSRFGEGGGGFGGFEGAHMPEGFRPPSGGFPSGSGGAGFRGFPPPGGGVPPQGFGGSSLGGTSAGISLTSNDSGLFTLRIEDADGIASFSLKSADGSPYGGDIPNCIKRHESTTVQLTGSFPYTLTYTDCAGNTVERTLTQAQAYGAPTAPPPGSVPPGGTLPPPPQGGAPIPQGFDPRSLGLPEGFQFDGSNVPPEFLNAELQKQIGEIQQHEIGSQFQQQYQDQYQQQYQQQVDQQYQQQYPYPPPSGTTELHIEQTAPSGSEPHIDSTAPTGFFLSRMIANAARAFLELFGK